MHQSSLHVAADAVTPAPIQLAGPRHVESSTSAPSASDATSKPTATFKPHRKTYSLMGVQIVGTGSYVPDNVVTNDDLKQTRGFDPAWIEQRSGILERRHAPAELATSDLCAEAGLRAMQAARRERRRHRPVGRGHVHARSSVSLDRLPGAAPPRTGSPRVRYLRRLLRIHVCADHSRPVHRHGQRQDGARDWRRYE